MTLDSVAFQHQGANISTSAENYGKSLGASVVLHKHHAVVSRFPTREAQNLFVKFLESRDYNFRLNYSTGNSVAFSLKAASLSLRTLEEERFALGEI
jgi:predicted nucleic acid-binding Zn finger protein